MASSDRERDLHANRPPQSQSQVLAALAHSDTHIPSRAVEMARSARQHPERDSPDSPTEPVSPSSPIRASEEWAVAASAPPIPRSSLVSLAPSHMLSPLICCLPSYDVSPHILSPRASCTHLFLLAGQSVDECTLQCLSGGFSCCCR
jgi:hypothetical protein